MRPRPGSNSCTLPAAAVRSQLERILRSEIFQRSERLSTFLRFVVEETLSGRGGGIKEQTLGSELYGKGPDFYGGTDPIVRVDARRLRDKLREYYTEFPADPIVISLPKGSYLPVFAEPLATPDRTTQHGSSRQARRRVGAVISLSAGIVLLTAMLWRINREPLRPVLLTAFPGAKVAPDLSPDGRFLAFSSKGPEEAGKAEIWIRDIDGERLERLTNTPDETETSPAWSPDGTQIAFVRDGKGVFVIALQSGAERRISAAGAWVKWAPDGRSVLVRDREGDGPYAVYQVFPDTLERRRLTRPPGGDGDWRFSLSPDGSRLAFVRHQQPGIGDVYLMSIAGGEPRRVTNWNDRVADVVWTPNGRDLIYSRDLIESNGDLWRISADLSRPGRGTRLHINSVQASNLTISRPRPGHPARFAFQRPNRNLGFRMIDLAAPLHKGLFQAVKPFLAPGHPAFPGPFSPNGRQFAFASGNPPQLWVADRDGTRPKQLTSAAVSQLAAGGWSPDGRRIVYDATIEGNADVFVVDAAGGPSRRLTLESSADFAPSWSRDGRWIYFSSTRSGTVPNIWRIPADGGTAVRITHGGGIRAWESPDGSLYYADRNPSPYLMRPAGTARLMRVPASGGSETPVLSGVSPFWWSATDTGIFFIRRDPDFDAIERLDLASLEVSRVGNLAMRAGAFGGQMNVSPDGRVALVTEHRGQADIMLVENIR